MGVVYKARQVKLNRTAALKMVLGDARTDSKEIIRFLAEAEAAAAIDHPNVVRVYEYGETDGRPFLAMEYLPGGTLADALKAGRLPPRLAAERLRVIADGVAAAHTLGIVHRDLKPANVLFDAAGTPKVADFGLAKRATGADLTNTGAVVGTPAYMAPEQAKGGTKFVGPQADVHALGVILFECLTGTRPFAAESVLDLLNRVAGDEPPAVRSRTSDVPRDLELVCLKCLRKNPWERYPTAAELADDLRAFLDGRVVSARPLGPVVRAVRWARRRPSAAALLGVLVLATAAVTGTSLWFNARLVSERTQKEQEAERAKRNEEKAVANLGVAGQAVDECYTLVTKDPRLKGDHLRPVRGLLSQAALKYYRVFTREVPNDLSVLNEYAGNLERVVEINMAIGSKQEALADCRDLVAAREKLLAADPTAPAAKVGLVSARRRLGQMLHAVGQRDAAVEVLQTTTDQFLAASADGHDDEARFEAAAALVALAGAYREMTRPGDALAAYERAVAVLAELTARRPDDGRFKLKLADVHGSVGYHHHLLTAQKDGGREKARAAYEASRALARELVAGDGKNPFYQSAYATSTMNLGILYLRLYGDPDKAGQLYQEAQNIFRRLSNENPFYLHYLDSLANATANRANAARAKGRNDEALKLLEESLQYDERLLAMSSGDTQRATHAALKLADMSGLQLQADRPEQALELSERAISRLRAIHRQVPDNYYNRDYLTSAIAVLGQIYLRLDRTADARAAFEEAVTHATAVNAKLPGHIKYTSRLSEAYEGLADAHRRAKNPAAAADATRKRRDLWADNPGELAAAAKDFAACVPLATADNERAGYVALTLETLRRARAAGLADTGALATHDWPSAVRAHPEFAAQIRESAPRPRPVPTPAAGP